MFDNMEPEEVEYIPGDIDGLKLYQLEVTNQNWTRLTSDLHYFTMTSSSKVGYHGKWKIGTCQGSWVCENKKCCFQSTSAENQPNRVNWKTVHGQKNLKMCSICEHIAECEGCGACKLVGFNPFTNIATVYHLGTHKCWQKISMDKIQHFQQKQMKSRGNRTGAAKNMAIEDISYQISIGDMDAAEELADKWSDLCTSKRIQNELDPTLSEDHNSFDAVSIIKRKTDTKDPYYIYLINNSNLNKGTGYIFKSSRQMTRIALADGCRWS